MTSAADQTSAAKPPRAERPRRGQRPQAAMILAAGRGERMRPLTDSVPKPLLLVRGQPLIERHVRNLVASGIARIVINLAWRGAQIREYLGDGGRYGAAITYSEEAPLALETGGGIFRALPYLLPGPFAVINGDIYTDFPLQALSIDAERDAHLVLVPNPPYLTGDFGLEAGEAVAVQPGPVPLTPPGLVHALFTFSGIAVYRPAFFNGCAAAAFPVKPLWLRAMAQRRCSAELYSGLWEDIGTPERLAAANR